MFVLPFGYVTYFTNFVIGMSLKHGSKRKLIESYAYHYTKATATELTAALES